MPKAKNKKDFQQFKDKLSKKRRKEDASIAEMEYITVQRLSSHVEGRYQKYSRIGALASVPLDGEATIQNIKDACKRHFNMGDGFSCDVLAGERGPSWTETSQITSWKALHVRFLELSDDSMFTKPKIEVNSAKRHRCQESSTKSAAPAMATKKAASMPLSKMLKLGKLIQPKEEVVTVQLEEFKIADKSWGKPFEVTFSLSKDKFASGSFRDAYIAMPISSTTYFSPGKYVFKKFNQEQIKEVEALFTSMEEHTRKTVQMKALVRNFALQMAKEAPVEFGTVLSYTKVYFGSLYGKPITLETYLEGNFVKHVNNTGDVHGESELASKAQTFSHYTYETSNHQLIVLDIQGIGHKLFDPEIATSTLVDNDNTILFCCGNLSTSAINNFQAKHKCNKFCKMLGLQEMEPLL